MVASHMGSDLLEPSAVCAAQAPALTPTMDDATAAAVRALGRTEDVMFSPGGALVAIVGHLANEILLLKVAITPQASAAVRIDLLSAWRLLADRRCDRGGEPAGHGLRVSSATVDAARIGGSGAGVHFRRR